MSTPRRALVVIDAQREYFDDGPLTVQYPPREESVALLARALDAADEADIPVVVVQHELPSDAPVFAQGSTGWENHPEVARRVDRAATSVTKNFSSIFAGTGLPEWLSDREVDTVTLAGYMTNNCVIASAAAAEPMGLAVEVLSDATGAIHISNEAGSAPAQQVHETLMAVLHSNWAAVADTDTWVSAVAAGAALPKSDLGTSAVQGQAARAG